MGYGWPALEVNNKGDAVIVYARSGTSIYAEARYSAYFSTDADIRSSDRLKKGEETVPSGKPIRWGDTAGRASTRPTTTAFGSPNSTRMGLGRSLEESRKIRYKTSSG